MKNNNSDFISLTAAVRRAKSEAESELCQPAEVCRRRIHSARAQRQPYSGILSKRGQSAEERCDCRAKSSLSAFP